MTRATCLFCGGKGALLCDTFIGWERKRGEMKKDHLGMLEGSGYQVPLRYRMRHTCDAQLCTACAVPAGVMFVRMRHCSFAESRDYCPGHGWGTLREEITGLQAQAFRSRWRATARATRLQNEPGYADQIGLFTGLLT